MMFLPWPWFETRGVAALLTMRGGQASSRGAASSPRLEGWRRPPGLLVRDGANQPPHHEGLAIQAQPSYAALQNKCDTARPGRIDCSPADSVASATGCHIHDR